MAVVWLGGQNHLHDLDFPLASLPVSLRVGRVADSHTRPGIVRVAVDHLLLSVPAVRGVCVRCEREVCVW